MEIKSLEKTDFDTLFRAFGRAFADYEVQLNAEQLRAMLTRRGFDPALSFAAFDGVQIAAFTLNGIGNFNGVPTASIVRCPTRFSVMENRLVLIGFTDSLVDFP